MTYKALFTAHQEDDLIIITPSDGAKIRLREKEIKPHQMDKEYYVECTPGQREEIIKVADEYGRPVYKRSRTSAVAYPNLVWDMSEIRGTYATKKDDPYRTWIPVTEFIARLKGEWVEKQEVDSLVGKWVKCTYKDTNKWTRIICQSNNPECFVCQYIEGVDKISNVKHEGGGIIIFKDFLVLSDPRDYNPNEVGILVTDENGKRFRLVPVEGGGE